MSTKLRYALSTVTVIIACSVLAIWHSYPIIETYNYINIAPNIKNSVYKIPQQLQLPDEKDIQGEKLSAFNIQLLTPWGNYTEKKVKSNYEIFNYPNRSQVIIFNSNEDKGGVIIHYNDVANADLKKLSELYRMGTETDYELKKEMLATTPKNLSLLKSRAELQKLRNFIFLKYMLDGSNLEGAVYKFTSQNGKGFLYVNANSYVIEFYDNSDKVVTIIVKQINTTLEEIKSIISTTKKIN